MHKWGERPQPVNQVRKQAYENTYYKGNDHMVTKINKGTWIGNRARGQLLDLWAR